MAVQLQFTPNYAIDGGLVAGAATAEFYLSGTTTPVTVYSDEARSIPHDSPLSADAGGRFPTVWGESGVDVKAVVKDSGGATIYTVDKAVLGGIESTTAAQVAFVATASNPQTDVQAAIEQNSDAIAALGTSKSYDVSTESDMSLDGGDLARRSEIYSYVEGEIADLRTTGTEAPTIAAASGFTAGASATVSSTYKTVPGFAGKYKVSFNMDSSETIAVGDRLSIDDAFSGLTASAYFYGHHGTFSIFFRNPLGAATPSDIASGVVTSVTGNGIRRLYLTVTSVVGTPTWDMDGEALVVFSA